MNALKAFARGLAILGPICIAVGFISLFFFQIPHGEITLPNTYRSESFYLEKGKSYTIKASGSNYPFGSSGGEITFFRNGVPVLSYNIHFSFDGDSTAQEIIIGDFTVSSSGTYYFQYTEEYSTIHRPVKLVIQESLVEHFLGLDSLEIMVLGVILLIAGFIISKGSDWISHRVTLSESEKEYDSLEIEESSIEFGEISCPNCGYLDEGIYCSNCGSRLRKYD
jgi:hypothetical protein